MKALLLAALVCSILLSVCGQENDQWKRMKAGSRSFRNGNTNSADNAEDVTKSRSNGRRQMFRKQGNGQDGTADGAQNGNRGNGRWQRPSRNRKSDWMNHIKATWNTFLSGEIQINERGFIFENKQIGFSMSTDPKLSAAGYNQSFAMFDFNTGKEAIRVEVLESLKDEKPNFADQKSREFWIRKKHLCFIMDVPVTFQDFSQELQLRSSSSQAGPIATGNVKTFVARQANRVTDLGSSGVVGNLCRTAAARGLAFSVVADSSVTSPMETVRVMGQVDPLQPLTSVPYEIKLEPGIILS
uniref:Uncharacterized protein LOC111112586 n=1 Tax=Crassostrea virginica TaxID=6565 RepID=A0A8B8BRA6_CRAVI|nr:uncharacterized protein LOC111112586 [Crassostrea virginica]